MMLSQPPLEFPPKMPPPQPPPQPLLLFPPHTQSKRIIQSIELHPELLSLTPPQPHPVAVKSLINFASKKILFMVYTMMDSMFLFPELLKRNIEIFLKK